MTANRFCAAIVRAKPSLMELYGRGSIIQAANDRRRNLNIEGLDAFDLRVLKADGTPWDFNRAEVRRLARHMVDTLRPTWIIGSPPCTSFCRLNVQWNYPKMRPEDVQQRLAEGKRHLHFMVSLYRI